MRTIKHWALAAAAAAALALAGCGGGGSSSSTSGGGTGTPDPAPKSALSYATDLNGSVDALMMLSAAATEDGSALMMAMKYSAMIGTETSDGDSMAAMKNAAMVLKAKADLMAAIEDAKEDKMEAEAAKAETEDADVLEALNNAISNAEDEIEAAEMVLNGDALAGYVEAVTGTDEDDLKTAADAGEAVAKAVAMALGPMSNTDGTGTRVSFETAIPTDTTAAVSARRDVSDSASATYNPVAKANKLTTDNHMGKTFAMIVGEDNLMAKQVNTGVTAPAVTRSVMAKSVDGMKTMALFSTGNVPATIGTDNGIEIDTNVEYMGIPGLLFCQGSDCKVEGTGDAQKLTGSWYLAADNAMTYYEKVGDATSYTAELYVNYGHWLVVDDGRGTTTGNDGQVAVLTYAALNDATLAGATDNGSWAGADPAATDASLRASSAIYSGMAVGRSVHKTLDSQGAVTDIQSGRFMADVELTATFAGAASTLGGMIDNFRAPEGSNPYAVDSSWEVTLNAITTDGSNVTAGVTEATGQDGDWTSDAYGATTARPVGIFGSFNAHFTDGHAAGAYATRR